MFEYKNIEAYNLFHQGALALAQIERNGMCINTKYLRRSIKKVADKIEQKTENLKKYDEYKEWQKQYKNNMNLDSTQQLGKVLFDAMGYKTTITTKTGKPKVDEGVLNGLKIKFVDDLLYIRKLKKAKTTYLEAILKQTIDGKLHPSFNLHLVQTFRSSSSAPNFQNIPKHNPLLSKLIRQAFIPRKNHHLIEVDYSGAEIRCFTGDTLIETIDGKKTIQEIVLTHTEKEIYVYCYNNEQKRIGISKVVDGGMTRVKTPIIKVTLDNGEIIKTTADHSFMLRTGEYKKAGQLNTGDSLMPFYKKAVRLSGGKVVYERIYLNNGLKMLAHNLIAMDVLDTCIKGSALLTNTHLKYAHSITLSEYKDMYNHKVLSVEPCGYDAVYNIEVDKHHNYALSAGVIVKNCAACYHKDNNMIKYITDESLDMHRDMAAQIYMIDKDKITKDIRHAGKNLFVFPQFYGDFYINCARNMWETIEKNKLTLADGTPLYTHLKNKGINKLGDCSFDATAKKGTFVYHMKTIEDDFWNNKFKKYGQWKWDWYNMYLKNGFFDTLTGFRLYGNFKKNEVINYPVQGSAFHWLLWSLIRLNKTLNKYKMKSVIIGQIHDSIVADVHKDELKTFLNITNKIMTIKIREYYKWIIVPLKIEAEISGVNESWYKLKEINI
jgi:hypothetical protein